MYKFAQKLGLIVFGITLSLTIAEAASRLIFPAQPIIRIEGLKTAESDKKEIATFESKEGFDDSLLDWSGGSRGVRLRPNTKAVITKQRLSDLDIVIKTNSIGLRYDELLPKEENEFRILMLGDSITLGDYNIDEETITGYLQSLLQGRSKKIKVINAGLPGASLNQELYHFLEIKDAVDPDLVLVGMYLNDAQNSRAMYMRVIPYPWSKSRLLSVLSDRIGITLAGETKEHEEQTKIQNIWKEEFRNSRNLKTGNMFDDKDAFDFEIYNAAHDFGLAWNESTWDYITENLKAFKAATAEMNIPLGVALYPIHIQALGKYEDFLPQTYFKNSCKKALVDCFDVLPTIRQKWSEDQSKLYYDHCHMTPRGNLIVAELWKSWLDKNSLIPG